MQGWRQRSGGGDDSLAIIPAELSWQQSETLVRCFGRLAPAQQHFCNPGVGGAEPESLTIGGTSWTRCVSTILPDVLAALLAAFATFLEQQLARLLLLSHTARGPPSLSCRDARLLLSYFRRGGQTGNVGKMISLSAAGMLGGHTFPSDTVGWAFFLHTCLFTVKWREVHCGSKCQAGSSQL